MCLHVAGEVLHDSHGGVVRCVLRSHYSLRGAGMLEPHPVDHIEPREINRSGNGLKLSLLGAAGNNLKSVDLHVPLGCFVCITGVSGSGKSSLINETLSRILSQNLHKSKERPLPYQELKGLAYIDTHRLRHEFPSHPQ